MSRDACAVSTTCDVYKHYLQVGQHGQQPQWGTPCTPQHRPLWQSGTHITAERFRPALGTIQIVVLWLLGTHFTIVKSLTSWSQRSRSIMSVLSCPFAVCHHRFEYRSGLGCMRVRMLRCPVQVDTSWWTDQSVYEGLPNIPTITYFRS